MKTEKYLCKAEGVDKLKRKTILELKSFKPINFAFDFVDFAIAKAVAFSFNTFLIPHSSVSFHGKYV